MNLKEHLEIVDIAHIIRSHFRFDLMEMYLLIKQRLNCIGNPSSVQPLSCLSGLFRYKILQKQILKGNICIQLG